MNVVYQGDEVYVDGKPTATPGQLLGLVGPSGYGKSMLQERVIGPFMGGLSADCLRQLTGERDFNAQLYQTRHWIISDGTTFGREKVHFTENIKRALVNKIHSVNAKYRDEVNVLFSPRISMSVNEGNLQSVPDLEEGIDDKVMLLKVSKPARLPSKVYPQDQFEADVAHGFESRTRCQYLQSPKAQHLMRRVTHRIGQWLYH